MEWQQPDDDIESVNKRLDCMRFALMIDSGQIEDALIQLSAMHEDLNFNSN